MKRLGLNLLHSQRDGAIKGELHPKSNKKKNRFTLTQVLSWEIVKQGGTRIFQKDYVYALLSIKETPLTRRQIRQLSGLEIAALCRCLRDLQDENLIEVAKIDKCPVTKRMVQYYQCISRKEGGSKW